MNNFLKILFSIFFLFSSIVYAGEVTNLFENEEYDSAYRMGYAKALSGDPENKFIIGKIYLSGLGASKKDFNKGLRFIKSSAEDDKYLKAIQFLADNYYDGTFTDKNLKLASKYMRMAEKLGDRQYRKKLDNLTIKFSGAYSKKSCSRYNKNKKKLANKIATCIMNGHLKGNASKYYLISFENGNIQDFLKAANRILKPGSGANLMTLIRHLPSFYNKASSKQITKLENIANDFGFDYKSCNIKKDKLGLNKSKGNVDKCVFAAIAGDSEASPIVAKWWRDGIKGLPKSKKIAMKMMENATSGEKINFTAILKNMENEPKLHFQKLKEFIASFPLNKKIIGKELKLEADLLAAEKHFEFVEKAEDISFVLSNLIWKELDSKTTAKLILLFYTDYQDYEEIVNNVEVSNNISKIPFSDNLLNLVRQKDERLALKYLKEKIFEDCNALKYALENEQMIEDRELLHDAERKKAKDCMRFAKKSNKNSMESLMKKAEDDFMTYKIPIEIKLESRKPCSDFNIFLKNKYRIGKNYKLFDIDFKKLVKKCEKNGYVSYEIAKEAFEEKNYNKAHQYSKKSCNSKMAVGCELIASIIDGRLSKKAKRIGFNEREAIMIPFLNKGHRIGDDKSSAMLFDIYNRGFMSPAGNKKKAEELINYLSQRDSIAAQTRVKLDCFSSREFNPLKGIFNSCKAICDWVTEELDDKNKYDTGTYTAIKKVRYNPTCCPENSCKRPQGNNISNSSSQ